VAAIAKTNRRYISIISKAAYAEIGGNLVDNGTLFDEAPPVQFAYTPYQPGMIGSLVPVAHAGIGDFLDKAWGVAKGAVGWVIPYQDFIMLAKQLYYLATQDWENFNAVDLAFSALGVITVIPVAKPLKLVLKPLKAFLKLYSKPPTKKVIRAVAGAIGKAAKLAASGKTQKLLNILPYLLIVGEMMIDAEAREGIGIMVKSISSSEDVWAWIDYMSLPAEGWEGDEIPQVELSALQRPAQYMVANANIHEWLAPRAHAAKFPRISGAKIGRSLKKVVDALGPALDNDPTQLTQALRAGAKYLKHIDTKAMRKYVQDPKFLASMIRIKTKQSSKHLKNFLNGKTDGRIDPKLMIAIIAYLEERILASDGKRLEDQNGLHVQINKLIGKAFYDIASDGRINEEDPSLESLLGSGHGAMFHLSQVAFYQFLYQFADGPKIKGIEMPRQVGFYNKVPFQNEGKPEKRFLRYVDIVLEDESNSSSNPVEEWIELKSLKKSGLSSFSKWKMTGSQPKRTKYHKQFIIDRVALSLPSGMARTTASSEFENQNRPVKVTDITWWFHKFEVKFGSKIIESYDSGDLGSCSNISIRGRLTDLPAVQGSGKLRTARDYSLDLPSAGSEAANNQFCATRAKSLIKSRSLASMLVEFGQRGLLPKLASELVGD
jgi:hypothetical protein